MIGIRRALKIRLMTGEAIQRRARIAIIHMTLIASRCRVRAHQGKARLAVIKSRRLPCAGGVAGNAVARKICGHVIGIARVLKIRLMTGETIHRRAGVAIVRMALIARHGEMRAGEREARAVMIERRRPPRIVVMAQHTILRIAIGNVIGIRRVLKIALMTREAIFRRSCKAAVDVATRTIYGHVCALQCKGGTTMIKSGRLPRIVRMTAHAVA